MLSFKQFLLNEIATGPKMPKPSAPSSEWSRWNSERRNQSLLTDPNDPNDPNAPNAPPVEPPPPTRFKPEDNNTPVNNPNTGGDMSGVASQDRRNMGGLAGEEGVNYARGHAQGAELKPTVFSQALGTGLDAAKFIVPFSQHAASATGRLSTMGYSEEGLLDVVNAYKDQGGQLMSMLPGLAGRLPGLVGDKGGLVGQAGGAVANELATVAAAALYDPRAAGAAQYQTPEKREGAFRTNRGGGATIVRPTPPIAPPTSP